MGLLDDAIREHLDLKRRRGADPAEVERAEREALGPVRRAPEGAAGAQDADHLGESAYAEHEPVYEHEPAHEQGTAYEHEPPADDAGWSHEDELPPPPVEHGAPGGDYEPEPTAPAPEPFDHAERGYEPPPEREPAAPPQHPADDHETAEYDVEGALGGETQPAAPAADDVLEETPEFLQDTPDHDRLWFEQRPPKDFDFDG